jgi:hypothetical protein
MPIAIHDTYFNLYDEYEDTTSAQKTLKSLEKIGMQRLPSAKIKSRPVSTRGL